MNYLTDISTDVSLRFVEIKKLIKLIEDNPKEPSRNTLLGMVFISLYSVYEFSLSSSIRVVISEINKKNIRVNELNPMFYSIAFHPDFERIIESGKSTKWKQRMELLSKIEANEIIEIPEAVSPNGGKNYRYEQLECLWKCLCIPDFIFPDNNLRFRGRVEELVRRRNEIAHGDNSAGSVGNQYTVSEINERVTDIGLYIEYVLDVFNRYIVEEKYKRISA